MGPKRTPTIFKLKWSVGILAVSNFVLIWQDVHGPQSQSLLFKVNLISILQSPISQSSLECFSVRVNIHRLRIDYVVLANASPKYHSTQHSRVSTSSVVISFRIFPSIGFPAGIRLSVPQISTLQSSSCCCRPKHTVGILAPLTISVLSTTSCRMHPTSYFVNNFLRNLALSHRVLHCRIAMLLDLWIVS
jgi:hypothetical protein